MPMDFPGKNVINSSNTLPPLCRWPEGSPSPLQELEQGGQRPEAPEVLVVI